MKGLRKLSAVALSAAMAATLSTPVFAAGTDVTIGDTDSADVTLDVTDANGNLVATTDNTTNSAKTAYTKKVVGATSSNLGQTDKDTLYGATDAEKNRRELELTLTRGDVKTLTATASSGDVAWYLDTEESDKNAEDVVTVDDGKITIAEDRESVANAIVYAYAVDNAVDKDKDGTVDQFDDEYAIKVTLTITDPSGVFAEYDNADEVYTLADLNNGSNTGLTYESCVTPTAINDIRDKKTALPTASHTAADLANSVNKVLNHIEEKESATFKAHFVSGDMETAFDSDYNNSLKFVAATPYADDAATADITTAIKNAKKYVKVAHTDDTDEYTVTVTDTATTDTNGLVWLLAYIGDSYTDTGASKPVVDANGSETNTDGKLFVVATEVDSVNVYRMYNQNTGEHFYTTHATEAQNLVDAGWTYEGIGWYAPSVGTPVYRVYNPNAGDHLFTSSAAEVTSLVAAGWNDEGLAFYSASSKYVAIYRQYNPNTFANNHNYTTSSDEDFYLTNLGWKHEGKVFYAVKKGPSADSDDYVDADDLADLAEEEAE